MDEDKTPEKAAVAVTFNQEKEKFLLLQKSSEENVNPGKWEFSQAKIEEEDEKPKNSGLRKLERKTGIKGKVLKTGESFVREKSGENLKIHPFLVLAEESQANLDSEYSDYEWIDLCELEIFDTTPGNEEVLEKLGVEK